MKNMPLWLGLVACTLVALANGCSKQESTAPLSSSEVTRPAGRPPSDTLSAAAEAQNTADAGKAADALKADDVQKPLEATAQKQTDAADQALTQSANDKLAGEQVAAVQQAQLASGNDKVQSLIASAQRLSGEGKWDEVLMILDQLANEKLSPAQQSLVDGLKSGAQKQAQAAGVKKASQSAQEALGGLLQPK